MSKRRAVLFSAIMAAGLSTFFAASAEADTFTLANSNGGDGYVVSIPGGFDLFGGNNGAGSNYTTYLATAPTNETLTVNWVYTTNDCCGAGWDPGGYVVNDVYTQLSPEVYGTMGTGNSSGVVTLSVLAGQDYGFYVYTVDGVLGRGDIAVTATPLPSTWTMLIAGFAGLGFFAYRGSRKSHSAALAAA